MLHYADALRVHHAVKTLKFWSQSFYIW